MRIPNVGFSISSDRSPSMSMLETSEILGYEVLGTLGYGARSTIYVVKDRQQQIFALKRVVKHTPTDQRFLEQAILEHEVASQLDHPNLRKSYKVYRQRALLRMNEVVVIMEMVDGPTLEHYKAANMVQTCVLFTEVARGLCAMHEAGYVHADIKPNNVLVTSDETVKIIDFGQSCKAGTIKQRIQGTPDYIAPEQVLRREITPVTDVFNLGATMYWVLTGQHIPTLIAKGTPGVSLKTESKLHPPVELNPSVPPALSNLVVACVQTDPAARPRTMRDVLDRLELAHNQAQKNGH